MIAAPLWGIQFEPKMATDLELKWLLTLCYAIVLPGATPAQIHSLHVAGPMSPPCCLPFAATHNALTAVGYDRWYYTHKVFQKSVTVPGLQGTRRPARIAQKFACSIICKCGVLDFGYGARSNKHAGVSLALRTDCILEEHVACLYVPEPCLQGRTAGVRIKIGNDTDFAAFSVYWPPLNHKSEKLDKKVTSWVEKQLDTLPVRCTCRPGRHRCALRRRLARQVSRHHR